MRFMLRGFYRFIDRFGRFLKKKSKSIIMFNITYDQIKNITRIIVKIPVILQYKILYNIYKVNVNGQVNVLHTDASKYNYIELILDGNYQSLTGIYDLNSTNGLNSSVRFKQNNNYDKIFKQLKPYINYLISADTVLVNFEKLQASQISGFESESESDGVQLIDFINLADVSRLSELQAQLLLSFDDFNIWKNDIYNPRYEEINKRVAIGQIF